MDLIAKFFSKKDERIYLDYAAATPVLPEVKREMEQYWNEDFYNPNAIYTEGERVKKEVEGYRERMAKILGVTPRSIIFTSGGTEANVLAVRGVKPGKVLTEGDVHPSITEAIEGRTLDTDSQGPTLDSLVSSATTDNKLGRKIREERKKKGSRYPLLHVDASQTAAYFDVGLEKLACDLLTLDAAKIYGPKGIGALIVRHSVKLDLPPRGTPAVPLIAGFVKALELAVCDREKEYIRLASLSARFAGIIGKMFPRAEISRLLPNIVNVSIPGILPEFLVLVLDRAGIMVSAGPACESNKLEPADSPVRFSLGRLTTEKELNRAAEIFCREVGNMLKSSHHNAAV